MKTKELMDDALDWAVARCEGRTLMRRQDYFRHKGKNETFIASLPKDLIEVTPDRETFLAVSTGYSRDWSLAGPIIEREGITIIRCEDNIGVDEKGYCYVRIPVWAATTGQHQTWLDACDVAESTRFEIYETPAVFGPTPLIAAMRAFVFSVLGEEVELPDELIVG